MSKKLVRGITDIKTISNQDFDTNNVNDLLSDGEHNYIHRKKKDKKEEYHNLTNNIKTIDSDNTSLLSVTNYNNTKNSATLHPHHDAQKEQKLYSTDKTIEIVHGDNGTGELTNVDVNPEKVLEHTNLLTDYGISKATSGNTTKLGIEYTRVEDGFDLNGLSSGFVRGVNLTNAPSNEFFFVEGATEGNHTVQKATALSTPNTEYVRLKTNVTWGEWREQVGDKSVIDNMVTNKQDKIVSNNSIVVNTDNTLGVKSSTRNYQALEGSLYTYLKHLQIGNTDVVEFSFTIKINENQEFLDITLTDSDITYFTKILTKYGKTSLGSYVAIINGLRFILTNDDAGSKLTLSRYGMGTDYNQVVSFSDIIDPQ